MVIEHTAASEWIDGEEALVLELHRSDDEVPLLVLRYEEGRPGSRETSRVALDPQQAQWLVMVLEEGLSRLPSAG